MKLLLPVFGIFLFYFSCAEKHERNSSGAEKFLKYLDTSVLIHEPFSVIKLPITHGVEIWNPSVLVLGPENRIFGCNLTGEIWSLRDRDGDGLEDDAQLFCNVTADGLRTPAGLAWKNWDLYVGLAQQIRVYRDTDHDLVADTSFVFFDDIPFSDHPYEYTSALAFDREGWLYCVLTTDSWNAGASPDPLKYRGSMLRISPDGDEVERVATGLRSVHGLSINRAGDVFFVDNQGGQNPTEELNHLTKGAFYGYNASKYGDPDSIADPVLSLQTEVAPAEIEFFNNDGNEEILWIAFYGPGEYWQRGGLAKVSLVRQDDGSYEAVEMPVVSKIPKLSGLVIKPTGEIYAAQVGKTDYWYQALDSVDGNIYRIIHHPQAEITPFVSEPIQRPDSSSLARGASLFIDRACNACHALDGKTELLGPNLKNIGQVYSRKEILEEIREPSKRMKPGMAPTKVTTVDGDVFLGRVIRQNQEEVCLMLIGNQIKKIPVTQIQYSELHSKSMMYEGLLAGLESDEIDDLIDYLVAQER